MNLFHFTRDSAKSPYIQTRIARLHALSRWVNAQQGRAIIHVDGRPTAVLVTYAEYNQLEKLSTAQMKQRLLTQLQDIRVRREANRHASECGRQWLLLLSKPHPALP